MAFKLVGSLDPHGGPLLRSEIITNSITIAEVDSVQVTSGFVALGTTGALVFGHVAGLISYKGNGLISTGAAGAAFGTYVGTFLTASDNQTVAKVLAQVDISKETMYSADPDAAIGTTTGSNLLGYHTDILDEDQTDETSAVTGTAQYIIWGVDPVDSGNQLVTIYESQVFGV